MATALAPVSKTQMAPRFTRGGATGLECWAAETTDGVWDFQREDSPGTPWLVYHKPSVADGSHPTPITMRTNLRTCRAYVASGEADRDITRLKCAHPREARSHLIRRGTFDYHYELCSVCLSARPDHSDDDGCPLCLDGRGDEHEWFCQPDWFTTTTKEMTG